MNSAVCFVVFNRPECTSRVFAEIRRAQPPLLLVVADGPRSECAGEAEACAAVRQIIDTGVDWPCRVLKNYSDTNLGCGRRVSSGLDWLFEKVERAIILEDDCLPDPSFFPYCEELLERFHDDERITMISGDNFQFGHEVSRHSYYFSRCVHIWGWASWRRAWRHYDYQMSQWPEFRDAGLLRSVFPEIEECRKWTKILEHTAQGLVNSWDYQWMFACWRNNGLSVLPECNLVTNIGCDLSGAHTHQGHPFANVPATAINFPLRHPEVILRDFAADQRTDYHLARPQTLKGRLRSKLRQLVGFCL